MGARWSKSMMPLRLEWVGVEGNTTFRQDLGGRMGSCYISCRSMVGIHRTGCQAAWSLLVQRSLWSHFLRLTKVTARIDNWGLETNCLDKGNFSASSGLLTCLLSNWAILLVVLQFWAPLSFTNSCSYLFYICCLLLSFLSSEGNCQRGAACFVRLLQLA